MAAQPHHLVLKRLADERYILCTGDAAVVRVAWSTQIVLPLPVAAPPHQHQQSQFIANIIYAVRRSPEALQSHGIHIHIAYIFQLLAVSLMSVAQIDVISPSGTPYQHLSAVERKSTMPFWSEIAAHLADAEAYQFAVAHRLVFSKVHLQVIQFGAAHRMAPPQARMLHLLFFRQTHYAALARGQRYWSRECASLYRSPDHSMYLLVSPVGQFRVYRQPSLLPGILIHAGAHSRMAKRNIATGFYLHFAEDAHALVGRARIPVNEADVGLAGLGAEHLYCQHVLLAYIRSDIEGKLPVCASHSILVGHQMSVEPDVGAIADAVEREQHAFL